MSKKEIKSGDVCYLKLHPNSLDKQFNGYFLTVTEKVTASNGEPAWKFKPDLYSPRHECNFAFAYEKNLVPIAGPTTDDVKYTLEVLAEGNNKTFEALRELGKKVKEEHYEEQRT